MRNIIHFNKPKIVYQPNMISLHEFIKTLDFECPEFILSAIDINSIEFFGSRMMTIKFTVKEIPFTIDYEDEYSDGDWYEKNLSVGEIPCRSYLGKGKHWYDDKYKYFKKKCGFKPEITDKVFAIMGSLRDFVLSDEV